MTSRDYSGAFEQKAKDDKTRYDSVKVNTSGITDKEGKLAAPSKLTVNNLTERDSFTPKAISEGLRLSNDLGTLDQGQFSKLVANNYSLFTGHNPQEFEQIRGAFQNETLEDLVGFGRKNSNEVSEYVWENATQSTINVAFNSPYFRLEDDKFNETAEILIKGREELTEINSNIDAYIDSGLEEMEKRGDKWEAVYFSAISRDRIKRDLVGFRQNIMIEALEKYGLPKFISQNVRNGLELVTHERDANLELAKTNMDAKDALGDSPNDSQVIDFHKAKKERSDAFREKYQDAGREAPKLTVQLLGLAGQTYDILEERKKRETDEKEAAKKAKVA